MPEHVIWNSYGISSLPHASVNDGRCPSDRYLANFPLSRYVRRRACVHSELGPSPIWEEGGAVSGNRSNDVQICRSRFGIGARGCRSFAMVKTLKKTSQSLPAVISLFSF
jgi:hypothetical protein